MYPDLADLRVRAATACRILADLPDLGAGFDETLVGRSHEARLRHEGLGV